MVTNTWPDLTMPEPVEGKMVPTLNGFGYMTCNLDWISEQFIIQSKESDAPVLEIGAAYGNAVMECLRQGTKVFANDIDPRHLEILRMRAEKKGWANNLILTQGSFPSEVELPHNYFSAVLACRVFHFFSDQALVNALSEIKRLLIPGGRLFVVVDTPFNNYYAATIPSFMERKMTNQPWPGLFIGDELPKYISGYDLTRFPLVCHLFDIETLEMTLKKAGFKVEKIEYISRPDYLKEGQMDGRECVGAVVLKQ